MYYQIIKAGKEEIGLVWCSDGKKPLIEHIYLQQTGNIFAATIIEKFPDIDRNQRNIYGGIDELIVNLYLGKKEKVVLSILNTAQLTNFSYHVLKATSKIPRGKVASYSSLAAKINSPLSARAVGAALANNPFPLIIPCHRVIRADRSLGGFGGGVDMKREILIKEGVTFDSQDRLSPKCIWRID